MPTVFSKPILTAALLVTGLGFTGCDPAHPSSNFESPKMMDDAAVTKAVATVGPSKSATTQPTNNNVTGTVTFTVDDDHLKFVADIDGARAQFQAWISYPREGRSQRSRSEIGRRAF